MRDNKYMTKVQHRDYGELNWVGIPASFSSTPNIDIEQLNGAPYIGEHSDTILKDIGYCDEEIAQLKRDGVIPTPGGMRAMPDAKDARAKYAEKMRKRKLKSSM